jgi:UDP-perosamine 4-acetyltransferase
MSAGAQRPLIILGGGGHARVLADCLLQAGQPVLGFTAPERQPDLAPGIAWLGDDSVLADHPPGDVALVNGIGSTATTGLRRQIQEHWGGKDYRFAAVRHPSALVAGLDVDLGQGCQLLAGSLLGPGVRLGNNVLVNSRAVVEHDCRVGDHCHIATGAILCGGCDIGAGVHVGAGATLIQGITVGAGAIIAAGTVVTKNVEPLTLVAGVPGRPKRALNEQDLEGNQRPQ